MLIIIYLSTLEIPIKLMQAQTIILSGGSAVSGGGTSTVTINAQCNDII
jgi:hypothetical protein